MYAGAIIALAISQPLIALPLAFVSHFVLDALPHYGYGGGGWPIEYVLFGLLAWQLLRMTS
jgi:hypothetical protein